MSRIFRRSPPPPAAGCPSCGRTLDAHDQHVRFGQPDAVLSIPVEERKDRTWETEVMMQVEGLGAFVRVLLPVRLEGGHLLTFGLWLGMAPAEMHRALEQWWSPSYQDLVLDGVIANEIWPWGILGKPARAVVRNPDAIPYIDSSTDHELQHVISDTWPHQFVLDAQPERVAEYFARHLRQSAR